MSIADLTLIYQGSDGLKAESAAVEGTHWAEGPSISAAIFRCAAEIGCIRRGEMKPRTAQQIVSSAPHSGMGAATCRSSAEVGRARSGAATAPGRS